MPDPKLPPEINTTVEAFGVEHKAFLASAEGKRAVKDLATFARGARDTGLGTVLGKASRTGAQVAMAWLARLPPVLVESNKLPLTDFEALKPKLRQQALSAGLQVLAVGSKALLLGAAGDKLSPKSIGPILTRVAFGDDAASAALRKGLLDTKWPWPGGEVWPVPGQLEKLVIAGAWRDLIATFARCGLAAQQDRGWVQQVQRLGRVTALKPARACAGQTLEVAFADFGAAPAAGSDVLLSVPTRNGCRHFAFSRIAPALLAPGGWRSSGSVQVTLPAEVFAGPVGFFVLPPPMKGDLGCEAGSLSNAAAQLQSLLGDIFGPAGVMTGQVILTTAQHVEAGSHAALPCATAQADGLNLLQAGLPMIDRFVMLENRSVHPQGTLTLEWSVTNADAVTIVPRAVTNSENPHELPLLPLPQPLPSSGRVTLQVPCTRRWEGEYLLQAINANGCSAGPVERAVRVRSGFSDWTLGVGKADVTDRRPGLPMAGFAYGQQVSHGEVQRDIDGHELPLYARAFYIGENSLAADRQELVIVVADIWTCTLAVKRAVVQALNRRFPVAGVEPRFNHANVMIAGTHTHAAPGGYSEYALYNLTVGGFDETVFVTIVDGIALAASQAISRARAGRLLVNTGELADCGVNRSMPAFERNPEAAAGTEPTDREMLLLKFQLDTDNLGGSVPIGALNWYAIHPTSLGMYNRVISGDSKGWAAMRFERDRRLSTVPFVAAFGNAGAGDISGNYVRNAQGQPEFRRPLGGELPAGGSFPPRSADPLAIGVDNARMQALGDLQYTQAETLFDGASTEVTGRLGLQHGFVDMTAVAIAAVPGARTWPAALGVSFGAGSSEDSIAYATMDGFDIDANIPEGVTLAVNVLGGITAVGAMTVAVTTSLPGVLLELPVLIPSLVATLTTGAPLPPSTVKLVLPLAGALLFPPSRAWVAARVAAAALPGQIPLPAPALGVGSWSLPTFLTYEPGYETGHGEKPIMFPVGLAKVSFTPAAGSSLPAVTDAECPLVPQVLPMHLVRIGSVVLAGVPAEFTATAGRRLKQTLDAAFGAGVSHRAVVGYCNGYSGYVTTREEYGAQHYEGASTLFGEFTLMAYQQNFAALAAAMQGGPALASVAPFDVPLVVHRVPAA